MITNNTYCTLIYNYQGHLRAHKR